jgi:UDP-2,3-diacylglucosamine pyrophosphatase LpxH
MLLHGDGLEDPAFNLSRPLFHRLLRHPRFIKIYQTLLPPAVGIEVMRNFSRVARAREVSETEKNLNKWAEKQLEQTDTDYIICGHDHTPRNIGFSFGTLINLGTFYEHQTVAVYNNGDFSLVIWDDAAETLQSFTAPN